MTSLSTAEHNVLADVCVVVFNPSYLFEQADRFLCPHPAVTHHVSHLFSGEMHALHANGDPDGEAPGRFQRPGPLLLLGRT